MKVLLHTLGWLGLLAIAPLGAAAQAEPSVAAAALGEPLTHDATAIPLGGGLAPGEKTPAALDPSALEVGHSAVETNPGGIPAEAIRFQGDPVGNTPGGRLPHALGQSLASTDPTTAPLPLIPPTAPPPSASPAGPGGATVVPTTVAPGTDLFLEIYPTDESRVAADGRSTLTLTGSITDADGNALDYDVVVTLTTTAGEFVEADYDSDRAGFQVLARRGQFQVTLRSSLEAEAVQIRAWADGFAARNRDPEVVPDPPPDLEAFTQVYFITELRPNLVSGYVDIRLGGRGNNFWGSFRDFLRPDLIGSTGLTVNSGLFAIGTTGEWQFTGAFNTERALNQTCEGNRLFRDVQFCEQRYPVYGDSSQVDFLTPSIDQLYLRFQRESEVPGAAPDYFLWGDYATPEFARSSQQFTATTRQLHGFKGNYTFGNFQVTALYANNLRPFQRDTLAPDGTSGFYFLSRRAILPGSEDVFIEVEELNRPGTVLERRQLFRGADYEIDYDRGTLLFRQPVTVTEIDPFGLTRVQRIVATYQVDGVGAGGNLYGARLQYHLEPGSESAGWAGFTALWEDLGLQQFRLVGVDGQLPLGESGRVVAELARSSLSLDGRTVAGNALRVEAFGTFGPRIAASAYLSSTEAGFSNTATTSFRPGQTRLGGAVTANLSPSTTVTARLDQEINIGTAPQVTTRAQDLLLPGQFATPGSAVDNTLTTVQVGVQQRLGVATLGVDLVGRSRSDRITGVATDAQQLVPRLRLPLGPSVEFLAQSELNFGSESDPLYPTRTTLGLEWAVEPGVSVRLAQQFNAGQPGSITSLDTIANHDLGDNTTLTSRYSLISGYNGLTGQSALGLNHRVVLAPGLRATLGYERIASDGFTTTGAGQQFAQPFAVGLGGSALGLQSANAYSLGLEYTNNPDFQASSRLEHRDSPNGSNTVFSAAAAGRITPALTTLFRFQQANYANQTITGNLGNSSSLRLGLAYRDPASDVFNGLFSYEYRRNPSTTPTSLLIGSGIGSTDHTFALEGIYAPSWQWEFYGKYAFRLNNATLAQDFSVNSSLHLAQFRTTYRFAYQWDVLGEVRWITQPTASFREVGFALELGYHLSPDLRIGAGYSFGSVNSDGFGGSGFRSASGPYLGVQVRVNQLFEGFGIQPVAPTQQQESLLAPPSPPAPPPPGPEASTFPEDWVGQWLPALGGQL